MASSFVMLYAILDTKLLGIHDQIVKLREWKKTHDIHERTSDAASDLLVSLCKTDLECIVQRVSGPERQQTRLVVFSMYR